MDGVRQGEAPGLLDPVERSTFWDKFHTWLMKGFEHDLLDM